MGSYDATEPSDANWPVEALPRQDFDWRDAGEARAEGDAERLTLDGTKDAGYRDRPLEQFRALHPDEYLEPWSKTTPVEPFAPPEMTVSEVNPRYEEGPAYQVNCADSARAFERTWRGDREEAAGRTEQTGPFGSDGETSDRTEQWAAEQFTPVASMDEVRDRLAAEGHGASAIVHTEGYNQEGMYVGHAFNVVNDHDQVRVVDAQEGRVYEWQPPTGHPGFGSVFNTQAMGWDATRRSMW